MALMIICVENPDTPKKRHREILLANTPFLSADQKKTL